MQSQHSLLNTKRRRHMPNELLGRFSSKADFIRFFKEQLQLYVPPDCKSVPALFTLIAQT